MVASHRSNSQGQWAPGTGNKRRKLGPVVIRASGTVSLGECLALSGRDETLLFLWECRKASGGVPVLAGPVGVGTWTTLRASTENTNPWVPLTLGQPGWRCIIALTPGSFILMCPAGSGQPHLLAFSSKAAPASVSCELQGCLMCCSALK